MKIFCPDNKYRRVSRTMWRCALWLRAYNKRYGPYRLWSIPTCPYPRQTVEALLRRGIAVDLDLGEYRLRVNPTYIPMLDDRLKVEGWK